MEKNFYRAFEDRFRGSRELIKSRLTVYRPFLQVMQSIYPQSSATDLGCGRGEWLEILQESGFTPVGIDLDEGMLAACIELHLPAHQGNALEHIKSQPEGSQSIVSAFHLAEHLPFDKLSELIADIKRSLKPGGLIILETPNPENLSVGSHSFHLDPSHTKPIPPGLLAFLCEYHGFARVKVLRLQTASHITEGAEPTLLDVLTQVSPDYAVIAQTEAPDNIAACLDTLWDQPFGTDLGSLASQYQLCQNNRFKVSSEEHEKNRHQTVELESKIGSLRNEILAHIHAVEATVVKVKAQVEGKTYTNLNVSWHTHLYRALYALFSKTQKPWHTHVYRAARSAVGDPRYKYAPRPNRHSRSHHPADNLRGKVQALRQDLTARKKIASQIPPASEK